MQKEGRFLIYGLTCPDTGAVRYIGKSSSGLDRPAMHLPKSAKETNWKARWIRTLVREGKTYGVKVLEQVAAPNDLSDVERFWIAQGRGLGWPLTNICHGGEGGRAHGKPLSAEARRKISETKKRDPRTREIAVAANKQAAAVARGRKTPPAVRAKISASNKITSVARLLAGTQGRKPGFRLSHEQIKSLAAARTRAAGRRRLRRHVTAFLKGRRS